MSINFYNNNARSFFESTKDIDVSPLRDKFTAYLSDGASILDAGCGSGRDSRHFLKLGYEVTAFDASKELAGIASDYIGQPVQVCRFMEFQSKRSFAGIWACASLLHVPSADLSHTLTHLAQYLDSDGMFYCSFKHGTEDRELGGRHFTDCNEERLRHFVELSPLMVRDVWITKELRPGREHEMWCNAILAHKEFDHIAI